MSRLSKEQEYLINRIPREYDLPDDDSLEPVEIRRAKKLVASYEEKQSKIRKINKAAFKKAIDAIREAVYFQTPEKALVLLKKVEQEFRVKRS